MEAHLRERGNQYHYVVDEVGIRAEYVKIHSHFLRNGIRILIVATKNLDGAAAPWDIRGH